MSDDFKTPCCGFDTSIPRPPPHGEVLTQLPYPPTEVDHLHSKSVICWNPYNKLVQCHKCGTVYTPADDVMLELIMLATDEQMAEAYRRAGKDMPQVVAKTRQVLLDAVKASEEEEGGSTS